MNYSICQRCYGPRSDHWNVTQAELHVGSINHWKVMLCSNCTNLVEQAVLAALKSPQEISAAGSPLAAPVAPHEDTK